jgi:coenzyme F420-reducing hydrogenase delta subunit
MPELTGAPPGPAAAPASRVPRIVGFLCDWSVASDGIIGEDGTMPDVPGVTLIKIPCSGFTRPAWLEFALRNGAEGVFVCGCPLGDCFNRYGNNLIGDRVEQLRRRIERQRINPERITAIFYRRDAQVEFVSAVRAFADKVAAMPGPVLPPARTAAAPRGAAPAKPADAQTPDQEAT